MRRALGEALERTAAGDAPFVRIVLIAVEGSTPRESGAAMIVTAAAITGTIGGGALEHGLMGEARELLTAPPGAWARRVRRIALGPALGQCCGGSVTALLERYGRAEAIALGTAERLEGAVLVRPLDDGAPALLARGMVAPDDLPAPVRRALAERMDRRSLPTLRLLRPGPGGGPWLLEPLDPPMATLMLYGAGHVGRALAGTLAGTPFDVRWIDTAVDRFPAADTPAETRIVATQPAVIARSAPADSYHLVMTCSHALDLEICHAVLGRGDFAYLGLIGSATKRTRFASRLAALGHPPALIGRLTCPIGLPGLDGKAPAVIAVSVAADLLLRLETAVERADATAVPARASETRP
jgi:xanthine dehydrogenase accessory factor